VRNVSLRGRTRSVTFIVDTGSPATFLCRDTLEAFDIDPDGVPEPAVRGTLLSGRGEELVLNLVIFQLDGPYHDINVLGMDYMMKCDVGIQVNSRTLEAAFTSLR
jgi:hypothetical protein